MNKDELNSFYIKNKNKMDKSNFKSKKAKFYNYILNEKNPEIIPEIDFNEMKRLKIKELGHSIACKNKPIEVSGNFTQFDKILSEENKYAFSKNSIDIIIGEKEDFFNIFKKINNIYNVETQGIDKDINDTDQKIQELRAELDDLIKGNGNNKSLKNIDNNLDDFIKKKYANKNDKGDLIFDSIGFLTKKQKEMEIYEYLFYVLYFLISSTLGFFYLYKNK